MSGDQIAQIAYLSLLGAALAGWYITENSQRLGTTLKQMAAWAMIFIGVVAAVGLWQDVQGTFRPSASASHIEVPRGRDGHFHLDLEVNGVSVGFLVDTGASGIVLSERDARRVGLDPDSLRYSGQAQTANGMVPIAPVRLDEIGIGSIRDRDVPALVNGGELFSSLLGMTYLERFARVSIVNDRLRLER